MTTIPSYIRDMSDFVNKLGELLAVLNNVLLMTLDVASVYNNIPHQAGIRACEEALNSRNDLTPPKDYLCLLRILKKQSGR